MRRLRVLCALVLVVGLTGARPAPAVELNTLPQMRDYMEKWMKLIRWERTCQGPDLLPLVTETLATRYYIPECGTVAMRYAKWLREHTGDAPQRTGYNLAFFTLERPHQFAAAEPHLLQAAAQVGLPVPPAELEFLRTIAKAKYHHRAYADGTNDWMLQGRRSDLRDAQTELRTACEQLERLRAAGPPRLLKDVDLVQIQRQLRNAARWSMLSFGTVNPGLKGTESSYEYVMDMAARAVMERALDGPGRNGAP
jgi:hypothetical protein